MCKQEINEPLRSYLDRFNKVAIQIQNLSDEMAIEAIKNGTRLGKLKEDIMIEKPKTFSEVMAMVTKLIEMDEDRRLRYEDDKTPFQNNDRPESRRSKPQCLFPRGSVGGPTVEFRKEVDNHNYTPLNAPRLKVLM